MCEHKEFKLVLEGVTIHGGHIHIYKCKCGLLDYKIEKWLE